MNTVPPTSPEPDTGRRYWRSLEQLAETPEFREWLEREFPAGATEWDDPVSRRHFVKIMSASFMLAGVGLAASGCRRPIEKLEPFGKQPQDFYVYGVPRFYATAMPTRCGAVPLLAKSYEGRPIKIEGNALYPGGNGGTDRWAQTSILNLYDPDRARRFVRSGNDVSAQAAMDFLNGLSTQLAAGHGAGLAFLLQRNTSPSRARLQKIIRARLPRARWYLHEALDFDIHRRAASQAFGAPVRPRLRYDRARVIVSLDCDFIGDEEDAYNSIRQFTDGRRIEKPTDSMNRLYVVEALMSLTGANADHRLRVPAGMVGALAQALLAEVNGTAAPAIAGVDPKWISECARDLLAHKGQSLVVAGYHQPLAVHLLVAAINSALGNVGKTVELLPAPAAGEGDLAALAHSLNAGEVDTLVILGVNPGYDAPADLDWNAAQRKAKTVVRLGYFEDETFAKCDWHLPMAHYLEAWGDALTGDGTLVPVQPLIQPLFGGVTELEVLARLAGEDKTSPYEIVRATFVQYAKGEFETEWKKFLYNGYLENSAPRPMDLALDRAALSKAPLPQIRPRSKDHLEILFYRDYSVDDGRYNNNGWLQEMPDPITKITWDNTVLLSRKTAHELGVRNSEVVEVTLGGRTVRGPIWVQPGMADYVLGLALGYGRKLSGRVGYGVGFNAYPLRTSGAQNFAAGVTIRKTAETYPISCTQNHWSMEGRPIIREGNLEQYRKHPDFVGKMHPEEPPVVEPLYPNPFDTNRKMGKPAGHHQWGMAIDLSTCVGCSTCLVACQSENNIPIVGKNLVGRNREMHWLRVDRYYSGSPKKHHWYGLSFKTESFFPDRRQQFEEWIDDVQVVTQPMLCQMCEAAPCENVCPVNATVHDQEGLNVMVYNRCVGTRYCSNNCPYKVRRFNFLDYNKRSIKQLKGPFYPSELSHGALWKWLKNPQDPTAGMREDDEWDLIKMVKNPDVTVRMRGVMEKCTYCIQRIQQAEIAQKVKARDSGDVLVPDGADSKDPTALKTACQQACPAGAIVFGNIADPHSKVSRLKAQQRNYQVLDFLLTKPRTTYLARLRNPNPRMPDYYEAGPLTLQEYEMKSENPFEQKGEGASHAGKGAL